LITEARRHFASTANATLTMLYWQVGQRIRTEILHQRRAAYGEQIVVSVGRQLSAEYGAGFAEKNLRRMMRFTEIFPDQKIVASLMRQLSWTHFLELLPLKDSLQREFYAEMCRVQGWSVRALRAKIGGLLYERTALSRKPAKLARLELAALRDEGQMELYLRWLDKHERKAGEEAPIGIILCSGKDHGRIELLELDKTGIHVAEYLTALPPKEVMQRKLKEAVEFSRARIERDAG
jgi:hypothetical protein